MSLSIRHWLAERHIEIAQLGHPNAQIAGIAFRIAQDMEVKSLTPFSISSLTEVLELPFVAAGQVAPALSQLTVGLLRILSRKKPLRRNEGTWLTFQVAYLNALQGILEQESRLKRPWVNRAQVPAPQEPDEPLSDPQLIALLKTLRPGRLTDSQAEQALSLVADSFLGQQMNNLAVAWFVANGTEETEAKLLTQRLSNGLPGHLLAAIAENALPLAQLQKFVRLGNLTTWRDPTAQEQNLEDAESLPLTLPLDLDREYYRAGLSIALSEPLFGKPFSLKDLYVPLKGKLLTGKTGQGTGGNVPSLTPTPPVDLMEWAIAQLDEQATITFIEGDPGTGKTSFCQILAARVAQELYPNWMPISIRLRDVRLGQTFEQTLATAFPTGRLTDTDGWFSVNSPPCLLLLDGLDELPPQIERHLLAFIEQVIRFQTQRVTPAGWPRHKIILTSRSVTLETLLARNYRQSSTLPLPVKLQRIAIAPLEQDEFRQWFLNWAKVQSKSIAQTYFTFLKHGGVFQKQPPNKEVATFLSRPLMLPLVGILHRDARVDETLFQLGATEIKLEIYDQICRWLVGEPTMGSGPLPELIREGLAHAGRSLEAIANLLEDRHPQQLRCQMQLAALTILQTGQYQTSTAAIQPSLASDPLANISTQSLPAFFFRSRSQGSRGAGERPINPSAPLQLEFSHPSLGEYLGAEEIALQLKKLTQQAGDRYGEVTFVMDSPLEIAEHLYGLLGYGVLSDLIAELAIERLRREQIRNADTFSFAVLFKRLYRFYRAYCRGRWLDEGIVHQAQAKFHALQNPLNALQIDASVGINVFLLLCCAALEAQIPFWPCGNPDISQEFDADQLLSFIGRTVALSPTAFWQRLRHSLKQIHLTQACLNQAMLAEANLEQANFSTAELIGINLAAANLQKANFAWARLSGANLSHADLSGANLEGADLSGSDLRGANLTSANLTYACLFEAQLDQQSHNFALRSGAIFSLAEFQAYQQSLVAPKVTTNLTDEDLLEEEPTIFIESAEGEPMFPTVRYTHGDDNYDGDTAQIEDWEQQKPVLAQDDDEDDAAAYEDTVMIHDSTQEDS
ncbi:MAG TPA: hypothetical protein DDZ80_21270 [Cyanobacteria bacterium UBA8803]|nr:hypothetical protein [Cyanobacteria bacterium UBA9273]HBL60872.1 hypothetical protein [Cyanobacteria bacterium UBA8803]